MKAKSLCIPIFFLLISFLSFAQYEPLQQRLLQLDSFNVSQAREKIFIHCDRFYYNQDDTLWLKGYILLAKDLSAPDSSTIVYLEVINSGGKIMKRSSTYSFAGLFYSSLALPYKPGAYTLRAYTNSMRNYGDSLFFTGSFEIIPPEKSSADLAPSLNLVNTNTPKKITASPNSGFKIDLQFFPEGGQFIGNKMQQIGFKAINIFGKGIAVRGRIENSKKQTVASFSAAHKGMGVVWMKPENNEKYTAVLDNGFAVALPAVQASGTQLQVINEPAADSVVVLIDGSNDMFNKSFFLRASANGITCAQGSIVIKENAVRVAIAKNAFPTGICRFTLYNRKYTPVNERIILIKHDKDFLDVTLSTQKNIYSQRDSVHIRLSVKQKNNQPVQGNFSVAVIDTTLVPYTKYAENIISYIWLSSDLKGHIEEPAYYFDNPLPEAVDALMLTQGWVQYDNFYLKPPAFKHEGEFTITGTVVNMLNKPVAASKVMLLGKTGRVGSFILSTETNNKGQFLFSGFPPFLNDSVATVIRALNKRGKAFGIEVNIDTPTFPATAILCSLNEEPLNDTVTISYMQRRNEIYGLLKNRKGYLQEVVIKTKAKVKGSKNLNEDGGSDQLITGSELAAVPRSSLLDVLSKKVNGFNKGLMPGGYLKAYKRMGDVVVFIIDGYNINREYDPVDESSNAFAAYEESYLKYITAGEVAGIEIMSSGKNTNTYEAYHKLYSSALVTYTFIEITTYSRHGAFDKKIPGMYLYNPVVPVISKTFYSPRYTVDRGDTTIPDYRSTVFWKPDIITNEKGEAEFSFFTSDNTTGYLMFVQGADMEGKLASYRLPVQLRKE